MMNQIKHVNCHAMSFAKLAPKEMIKMPAQNANRVIIWTVRELVLLNAQIINGAIALITHVRYVLHLARNVTNPQHNAFPVLIPSI